MNVKLDIMRIKIKNVVGQMTTHAKAAGSSSIDEICYDVSLTDDEC